MKNKKYIFPKIIPIFSAANRSQERIRLLKTRWKPDVKLKMKSANINLELEADGQIHPVLFRGGTLLKLIFCILIYLIYIVVYVCTSHLL